MQEPEPEEVGRRSEGGHQLEVVQVPGGRAYNFYTLGNAIEGDRLPEAMDVQFPWETHPQVSRYLRYLHYLHYLQRSHEYILDMPPLTATRYPVTNEDYWQFLQVTERNIIGRNCKYFSQTGDGVAAS